MTHQRQRDELDPARDDDLRGAGTAPASGGGSPSSGSCPSQSLGVCGVLAAHRLHCARVCDVPAAPTILFVGDVVGGLGRRTLLGLLPALRERYAPTFVVVNGENIAGGLGITPKLADELFAGGVDAITLGNHTYRRQEIDPYLDRGKPIVRPANYLRHASRAAAAASSSATACASASSTSAATCYLRAGRVGVPGDRRRRSPSSTARSTTSSSTCTPRRPARRSRWAGTSTAA